MRVSSEQFKPVWSQIDWNRFEVPCERSECLTPIVFAQKAKINSSDINGHRTTSAMFDFRTYGNTSYILLQNQKFTDIRRRSMSAVGQYRTGKQDKWKCPLTQKGYHALDIKATQSSYCIIM